MTDNRTLIQNLYLAFAEGDVPGILALFAEDIKWTEAQGFPYGGTYIGGDDVLTGVFMRLAVDWDDWSAIPHEHVVEGDTVVTLGEYSGTNKATGKSFKAPLVHVWRLDGGKIVEFVQHTDTLLVRNAMVS